MHRKNVLVRIVGHLAIKFRVLQEVWILPWWGSGGLVAVPLWTLDTLVLVVKLFSTCTMAVIRVLIPPAMKSMHGETVLITGAGHGLGRELAIQLAELGATVICWDNDMRRNSTVVKEIREKDGECFGYTIDVTARDQVTSLALRMRQLTDVTMVISNAGAFTCAPICHLHQDSIARLLEVNLLAHFWMTCPWAASQHSLTTYWWESFLLCEACSTDRVPPPYCPYLPPNSSVCTAVFRLDGKIIQAFLPSMIERRHGHIVAINSSAGLVGCADMIPYCAAKFGLRGLMDSITEELRLDAWTRNIHTTSVYLATVSTGLYPPPAHRFTSWYSEITPKEAAKIIIEGIRRNHKNISIPSFMKLLFDLNNLLPYRIRIIFTDFCNFRHRGWFCFC